ncbi:hypothetical protein GGS23DRAFT_148588 [Durotheca rogersii]|uniref:uncharacterized protein n=1 Tax=Durotheca rogersii TaxID=419775 RepID=UPI00221FA943|nr:uncharacterized protein GGS23DRAFT_148588 [Durotheca rogersii]KAI5861380.1 hypothetical protein GGS23DRAFT_148588 [Durotheca rogersii]
MAPNRGPGNKDLYIHEIDRTPEYVEFIQKLTAFHEQRGTSFEPEPRLPTMHGHVNVDLLKLYRAVIDKGGYDELNKVQKAWGALAGELGMHHVDSKGIGQLSFQLKQDFYRYLSAYWIQDQYGREPPPKEILELQSCASKNGPVLTRTAENFKITARRIGEDTPVREERPSESTPVSGNRASGRLREAPPQRVPFQPETGSSRQPRHTPSQHGTSAANTPHTPQPIQAQAVMHPNHTMAQHPNPNNPIQLIQAQQSALRGASTSYIPPNTETASRLADPFEPRQLISVPLRPVTTPSNNPTEFAKRLRQFQSATGTPNTAAPVRPAIPGISTALISICAASRPSDHKSQLSKHLLSIIW